MSSTTSPTVSRRWLALEMKRLRETCELSQRDVAKALGCQVPKISFMENEQRPIHEQDLEILLELFGVPVAEREGYRVEVRLAGKRAWWEHDDLTMAPWLRRFVGLEQGAQRIRAYQPAVVHGLLQTPDYAAAILQATFEGLNEEKCRRLVKLRLRRQRRFLEEKGAPELMVVLDESALRREVGDPTTMRTQRRYVAEVGRLHPNVSVQIVPLDELGAYEAALGAFTILDFNPPNHPSVVYREHRSGADFLDGIDDIDAHSLSFERLSEHAVSPEKALG